MILEKIYIYNIVDLLHLYILQIKHVRCVIFRHDMVIADSQFHRLFYFNHIYEVEYCIVLLFSRKPSIIY